MGDAQSAQREGKKNAAPDEESGKVDDAQTEQNAEDEPLKKHGQISEINGKSDGSVAEVNGHCEDEIAAEAIPPPDEDFLEREKQVKDEDTPVNVEINEKESPIGANEDVPKEMIEIDAKQNDINESFRRFFSNIGLKLTVKRGSGEIATDVPDETNKEEPKRPEDVENISKETTSENAEQNTDVNIAQETYDNDSTTCPTLTDVTSEDVLETAEEKTKETKEEVESDNVDKAMTSPVGEDAHQDATPQEVPHSTSPSSPEEEVVMSPLKRFFTTGIFSGLQKKKKPTEVVTTDKELADMGEKEVKVAKEQPEQDQQQDKEDISLGVEAATVETAQKENDLEVEIMPEASAETINASTVDPSTIIVTEPEILDSQEKDKVQASPLKRLLSGSSLKKLSKRQRSRRSSDAKLSDSGEHVLDQCLSSTESAENQKEETCAQSSADAAAEEDGAWASFKKLMTPKKRMKRSSLTNEETRIPGSVDESKPSEGGQISDHSTEEGKKRKDSSVSWESVLCGSGRRRSRKTSDSEEETPQTEANKQDGGSKNGAESALESSNEADDIIAYSPKQAGSPSDSDGGSTWKSLKKLVTPKRKVKDEDESKDNVQSDSEVPHDESSFSIKKLLPGRKKWKSAEKQDQVSSDEADKDVASGDEDSETPAVVPLSEFDTVEMEVHIQTQADIESHIPTEAAYELQQDLLDQIAKPVLPCDTLQTEAKEVQDNNDALENQASKTPSTKEEPDDLTESISKPQLSDIPEEATPASATEEAARDDTIAEDLIEITSEAFTAPEPLDITQADETEMISAVSQLSSESSKTSGNTTPVPAEYDFLDTEVLLNQVVDNISVRPKAVPVCSDQLRSERIVVSVSHQILETFVKEEPTIQETQRGLDATTINTVLNVQEVIAIDELAATTQTDSISEVIDSISTEIASEVLTEDFDTAEIAIDEIHEVNVAHQEDSLKELESIDEYHHVVECLSEVNTAVSTDILPEGDETFPDNGSLVVTHQAETEPPKIDSQEADSAATLADETKDGAKGQEVPTLTEKEDQIMHKITEQIQIEDKDQPLVVKALEELAAVQAAPLDSEESRVQSLEKDIISENIPGAETVAYELKEEMVLTEVNAGPEKRDEMETDASKTVRVQQPEVLQAVQAATLDSEEGSVQSPEEGIKSENISVVETATEEPQEETILHTEVKLEPTDASKPEHAQEPEVLQAAQAATFDSEDGSVQLLEKDVISEDRPVIETFSYKLKEETVLSKVSVKPEKEDALDTDAAKPEHVQASEASEAVQASTLDSEEVQTADSLAEVTVEPESEELPVDAVKTVQDPEALESVQPPSDSEESSVRSLEKDIISVDIPVAKTVTYKFKEKTVLAGVNVEPEKEDERENDIAKPEHVQVPEASEPLQASTLDSEESSVQTPEGEVKSKDIPTTETVTDEPKQTAENLSDVIVEPQNEELSVKAIETVQEPEAPESVQASTDSEEGSVQSLQQDIISANVPTAETDAYKLKEETVRTEVEPEKEDELERDTAKPEHVQLPEASEPLQASTLDWEENSVQTPEGEVKSKDIPTTETVTDEPKQTAENLSDVIVEPQNKELSVKAIETVQEPEAPESVQASTDSEEGSVQSLQMDIISVNVPTAETDAYKIKEETVRTEVEPEKEDELERDTAKPEHVQLPEASEPLQASTLDSEESSVQTPEGEVKSKDIPTTETVTDEPKQTAENLSDVIVEPQNKELSVKAIETVQEPEAPESVQASTDSEEGSVQSLQKDIISVNVPTAETETYKLKEETVQTEVNVEPEKEDELERDTAKPELPEASEPLQASSLDSEEGSGQSPEEVKSEDISPSETLKYELKKDTVSLTEVYVESEKEAELETDAAKPEQVQVPEAPEAAQASTLDSEQGSIQSPEQKAKSEDIPRAAPVTDEAKQTAEHLTEITLKPENKELPVNAVKTVQEQEVSEAIQATTDSEGNNVQLQPQVISEDIPEAKTTDENELKKETMLLTIVNREPLDADQTKRVQVTEASEAVTASTLGSEEDRVQSPEEKVKFEDISKVETITNESKEDKMPFTEANLEPVDADKSEQVHVPEAWRAVQASTLDSKESSVQSPEEEAEPIIDEPKQTEKHLTEGTVDPEDKELLVNAVKTPQEPEALESVQAPKDSEEDSVQPFEKDVILEDAPEAKTVRDEPKKEAMPLAEFKLEVVDASKTDQAQEPEVLQTIQAATLDSVEGGVRLLENEVFSEDILVVDAVSDEPKQETEVRVEPEEKLPVEAAKAEHVQEPKVLQAVQVASLDSEASSLLPLENEVISEDGSTVETVTEEPKQETEVMTELEEKLLVEATKMEHVQEPEVLQTIQAVTLDSEVGNLLPLEHHVISRHILAVEKVTEEPKQENEVRIEPEEKLLVEASETEHVQEPEVLQAVQAVTLASEVGSLLPLEKEVTLEDIPAVESVTDEPKQEMVPLTEVKLKVVDTSKTENVQELEVLQAVAAPTSDSKADSLLSLEKEVISEEIPAVETATDEPRQETELRVEAEEKLQTAAAKTERIQEPESLSSDNATETETEEGASVYGHTVTENVEGGEAQELGKQILSDFPNPDADNIIASVIDDIKHDSIPKVIDELQALTAVCVSVNEDVGHVHVLEKTEITKETPTPCEDNAAVTNEPKHEVHLSAVQVTETTVDEHAVVALTVPCNFKDVAAAIPDVLIEETAAITEPLIDTVTSELVFKEGVEATTSLVKDAVAETAEESSVVVIMHVPSVEFEDNHTIEVKVVDADIKSAETIVDTVLEAGVTEDKEVIDVCHVMVTKVDNLSATPKLEEELTNEENKVTIQEVIQHAMEHLPGTVPESVVVNLEEKSITQRDAVTEVSEMVESESNDMEDQKVMEDSTVTFKERRDEDLAVISNDSGQKASEDIMQTPGSLEVFIRDHKDNSEETKAEWEKSEAGVTAEEVRSSSEELHVKEMNEEAQITQIDPSLNVTPSDTGLAVPQNTGIISSITNVESPSSQVMSPTSLPSTTEGKGPEKKIEVSEFTVQEVEPVNPTRVKSQEQTELTEITLQTTEITEPATNLDSMERNVITTQHVLLDVEVTETVELVEHIKSTERVTSRVQVTETIQSLQQTEQREVFLSQQVLSETRAEEPVTQKEEENDQDEWMDAEEDIYTQEETEVSLHRVEESPELRTEREQERLDYEFEMAPSSKTEEKESQQEMYKTAETCEIDSEGEDFAVALEHPEAETARITTME
ncbi:hypothetical protein ABVT39_011972 [Epinephelus coioides]